MQKHAEEGSLPAFFIFYDTISFTKPGLVSPVSLDVFGPTFAEYAEAKYPVGQKAICPDSCIGAYF